MSEPHPEMMPKSEIRLMVLESRILDLWNKTLEAFVTQTPWLSEEEFHKRFQRELDNFDFDTDADD